MACGRCKDTPGKLVVNHAPSGESRDLGDGVTISDAGGFSTRACPCVRDLPPVEREATWWEAETVWSRVHAVPIRDERIEIDVSAEVPRTKDGYRAVMRGNRYYPTLIHVEQPESLTLLADDAIDLALALLAAAYAAKAVDDPCEDCWAKAWPDEPVVSS
jgi:hypothetical protein